MRGKQDISGVCTRCMQSNEYITNAGGLGGSSKEAVKPDKTTQGKGGEGKSLAKRKKTERACNSPLSFFLNDTEIISLLSFYRPTSSTVSTMFSQAMNYCEILRNNEHSRENLTKLGEVFCPIYNSFRNYSVPARMAVSVPAKRNHGRWSAREWAHGCAPERLREQK